MARAEELILEIDEAAVALSPRTAGSEVVEDSGHDLWASPSSALRYPTCATDKLLAGSGFRIDFAGIEGLSQLTQSARSRMAICRSW
jgi:hypothetical protein